MSTIKVVAGDLDAGAWQYSGTYSIMSRTSTVKHMWAGERYDIRLDVVSIEPLTEEKVKKLGGTAAWGIAGAALLGPLGAIGGMLIGGNKTQIGFICHMKDGRKFVATTDSKTWQKIIAARL